PNTTALVLTNNHSITLNSPLTSGVVDIETNDNNGNITLSADVTGTTSVTLSTAQGGSIAQSDVAGTSTISGGAGTFIAPGGTVGTSSARMRTRLDQLEAHVDGGSAFFTNTQTTGFLTLSQTGTAMTDLRVSNNRS